jgi:hypothetical protein
MSVMNVLRKGLPTAVLPVAAGLAATGLAIAPAAQAASTAPARAASTGLHVTGKVDLGRLGPDFSYVLGSGRGGPGWRGRQSLTRCLRLVLRCGLARPAAGQQAAPLVAVPDRDGERPARRAYGRARHANMHEGPEVPAQVRTTRRATRIRAVASTGRRSW